MVPIHIGGSDFFLNQTINSNVNLFLKVKKKNPGTEGTETNLALEFEIVKQQIYSGHQSYNK